MQKYYTTLEISSDGYIGIVYDSNTNQVLYKTKPHPNQVNVSEDVNNFLTNSTSSTAPQVITNTTVYQSVPHPTTPIAPKRCCGR